MMRMMMIQAPLLHRAAAARAAAAAAAATTPLAGLATNTENISAVRPTYAKIMSLIIFTLTTATATTTKFRPSTEVEWMRDDAEELCQKIQHLNFQIN